MDMKMIKLYKIGNTEDSIKNIKIMIKEIDYLLEDLLILLIFTFSLFFIK